MRIDFPHINEEERYGTFRHHIQTAFQRSELDFKLLDDGPGGFHILYSEHYIMERLDGKAY